MALPEGLLSGACERRRQISSGFSGAVQKQGKNEVSKKQDNWQKLSRFSAMLLSLEIK